MPGLVPGIHVFAATLEMKTWMAGHRRAEATPSFERLCPAMTIEEVYLHCLFRPAAEIVDQAHLAARLARQAGVTAMQDQPVMGVKHEFVGDHPFEPKLHFQRRLARCKTGAIADAK